MKHVVSLNLELHKKMKTLMNYTYFRLIILFKGRKALQF